MEFLWHVKDVVFTFSLNGVYSEKFGGSRVYAKVRYGSGTVVLDILFFFIYSRHLVLNLFQFPLTKGKYSRQCVTIFWV